MHARRPRSLDVLRRSALAATVLIAPCPRLVSAADGPEAPPEPGWTPSEMLGAMVPSDKRPPNTGDLAADTAETVRRRSPEVEACYLSRLRHDPGLAGRLDLVVQVEAGAVVAVEAQTDELGDPHLTSCAVAGVSLWQFPPGLSDTLHLPFQLAPPDAAAAALGTARPQEAGPGGLAPTEVPGPDPRAERALRAAIEAGLPDVSACVEAQEQRVRGWSGAFELVLEVREQAVAEATVRGLEQAAQLESCLMGAARAWRFPGAANGQVVVPFAVGD